MKRRQKIISVLAGVALVGAGAGGAWAYYSSTTTGEGSTTLSGADLPELDAYAEVPDLALGESGPVEFYATNTGTADATVNGVGQQGFSVIPATSEPCPGGSFEFTSPVTQIPVTIAPGDTAKIATQTLTYRDFPNVVQNGCVGATVLVTFRTL